MALIWALRIVLPIVLFCIYFKLQSPKDEQHPGPSRCNYARRRILERRQFTLGEEAPEEMRTLALKDQNSAPALFAAAGRQARGPRREERPRDRRDRKEPRRERPREGPDEPERELGGQGQGQGQEEEKMHLESLLNYVAFNRREQQRAFLLDDSAPPPPPKAKKAEPGREPAVAEEVQKKANQDAQLVLSGAINYKRADVARDIYEQLVDTKVEISERTFALMIEACVLARDLKSASDFLMKMETSGHCPDSELLDKVMDLYSSTKAQREQDRGATKDERRDASAEAGAARAELAEEKHDGLRAKLSSDARIFVPQFGIPPPPPQPAPQLREEFSDLAQCLQRTRLTAAAKPFEPQFNYTFDACTYTWSPGQEEATMAWSNEAGQEEPAWGDQEEQGWSDQPEKQPAPPPRQRLRKAKEEKVMTEEKVKEEPVKEQKGKGKKEPPLSKPKKESKDYLAIAREAKTQEKKSRAWKVKET